MRVAIVSLCVLTGCSGAFPADTDAGAAVDGPPGTGTGPSVLPFAVDDWYGPSGYMGDGATPGAIVDAQTCIENRPASWMGNCHRYTWTPGPMMWAGVYWQYPDGNWGDQVGLRIPAGATRVTFRAWGASGGETVDFMVGMMAVDGFQVTRMGLTLGTEPAAYELVLGEVDLHRVVGGFGWVAKDSTTPVTFGVDDIRWE